MESKKMRFKRFLYFSVVTLILTITTLLYVNFRPIKARADNDIYFIDLNAGYGGTGYSNFVSYYDYSNAQVDTSTIVEGYNNDYAYQVYTAIGGDMPNISSVFVSLSGIYADFTNNKINSEYTINNVDGGIILECGFFYQDITSVNQDLDSFYLPYKLVCSLNSNDDTQLAYLDLTDTPISTEGFCCFVIRYTSFYFSNCVEGVAFDMPHFLFTDLKLNNMSQYYYDFGYSNGYDDGSNLGYDDGYSAGYYQGRLAGLNESSADYGIKDLLFTIFDAPFEVMYNLFSFTLFGTTMWTIIVSLTTLLLVLWLLKRFLT